VPQAVTPPRGPRAGRQPAVRVEGLVKRFTLHLSGPTRLEALAGVSLEVDPGSCLGLSGPSGSGKSTLLRCLYGNYRITAGEARVTHQGLTTRLSSASARQIIELRRNVVGHVNQFLRVIPRVPAIEVVEATLAADGRDGPAARRAAGDILARLNVPERLWSLPPATFSGGERQRVNLARVLVKRWPVLLLDEPTASLDAANRDVVAELILEARQAGSAVIGVFHDLGFLARVADRTMSLAPPGGALAASGEADDIETGPAGGQPPRAAAGA
jgi:alpha-D-ribose 1-methylphosphonate 5-triphosphate synthase subunit PhnL